ncbi:MAG: hypothetical protein KI788_14390, partial [Mameliella sp.]|nr:hypothetical protein [Mameliella sp.]
MNLAFGQYRTGKSGEKAGEQYSMQVQHRCHKERTDRNPLGVAGNGSAVHPIATGHFRRGWPLWALRSSSAHQ